MRTNNVWIVGIPLMTLLCAEGCRSQLLLEKGRSDTKEAGTEEQDASVDPGAAGHGAGGEQGSSGAGGGGRMEAAGGSNTGGHAGKGPLLPDADVTTPLVCGGSADIDASGPPATRWIGNGPSCPGAVPFDHSPCDAPVGQVCFYSASEDAGTKPVGAFVCLAETTSTNLWFRFDTATNLDPACPPEQPLDGDSCNYPASQRCWYPNEAVCTCPSNGAVPHPAWDCVDATPQFAVTPPVSPNESVRDMSDDERREWCEWFACLGVPAGGVSTASAELSSDGYATGSCMKYGRSDFRCLGTMPSGLPVEDCVANLSLSRCEAPTKDLDDCVIVMLSGCMPSALTSCGHYLSTPGCSGTIVTGYDQDPNDGGSGKPTPITCKVRVR